MDPTTSINIINIINTTTTTTTVDVDVLDVLVLTRDAFVFVVMTMMANKSAFQNAHMSKKAVEGDAADIDTITKDCINFLCSFSLAYIYFIFNSILLIYFLI